MSTDPTIVAELHGHGATGRSGARDPRFRPLREANVLAELRAYHELVSVGSYCIVEDSNVNGHPVSRESSDRGPWKRFSAFLRGNDAFVIDRDREKFFLTFNPERVPQAREVSRSVCGAPAQE